MTADPVKTPGTRPTLKLSGRIGSATDHRRGKGEQPDGHPRSQPQLSKLDRCRAKAEARVLGQHAENKPDDKPPGEQNGGIAVGLGQVLECTDTHAGVAPLTVDANPP